MSKTKKILYLILCILILTILIPILLDYHKVSGLGLHLVDWKQISFLEFYLSRYIFWGYSSSFSCSVVPNACYTLLS